MNRPASTAACLALVAALACGAGDARKPEPSAEVQRDLAMARARGLELANSAHTYQPVRFVSAIEQTPPAPIRSRPREVVLKEPVDTVSAQVEPSSAGPESGETPAPVAVAHVRRVPSVVPLGAPTPERIPGGHTPRSMPDRGPDIGSPVGVVIRGGMVDPRHCPPRRRPPSLIPGGIRR